MAHAHKNITDLAQRAARAGALLIKPNEARSVLEDIRRLGLVSIPHARGEMWMVELLGAEVRITRTADALAVMVFGEMSEEAPAARLERVTVIGNNKRADRALLEQLAARRGRRPLPRV